MVMTPRLRKFTLAAHVVSSVGWLGAVIVFLALALIGWHGEDSRTVRGAYVVMEPAAWLVLVPLAFASLLTGLVQALGTTWGLFRHYWILFKLLITVFATVILLIYMATFALMAGVAADPLADLDVIRNPSPTIHAALALLLLLVAMVLAMYKPQGEIRPGAARQYALDAGADRRSGTGTPRWVKVSGIITVALALLLIALFSTRGLHQGHGPPQAHRLSAPR